MCCRGRGRSDQCLLFPPQLSVDGRREDRRKLGTSLLGWEEGSESSCQEDPDRGERTAFARAMILTLRMEKSQGNVGESLWGKNREE